MMDAVRNPLDLTHLPAHCTLAHTVRRGTAGDHDHVPDANLGLPVSRKKRQGRMRALRKAMMEGGSNGGGSDDDDGDGPLDSV